jgi:23S rRNA U2552 (ribose-2'-O)-methylase RlmE/FtsJ
MTSKKVKSKNDLEFSPFIMEIPDVDDKLQKSKQLVTYSHNIDYPMFELGFHHFIHKAKNSMEIVNQFEGKKRVYLVLNNFERYVDEYNESINDACLEYFDLKKKPKILSRGFFKLWEILMAYDVIPTETSNFVSASLAESPGSFLQAIIFYRDLYAGAKAKKDKYHAVSLHPEDEHGHVPDLDKEFINYYGKESPKRFIAHKTYSKQVAGGFDDKHNGDITDPKTLNLFGGQVNEKADFITADGGFNWDNENTQEQEAFKLIYAQIVGAIKLQKKGGSFVCKFFETFTMLSMKFISILKIFYKDVFMVKPLMSRESNSEKYFVCKGFLFDDKNKEYQKMSSYLEDIMSQNHKTKSNMIDIFPDFNVNNELIHAMTHANTSIANSQMILIHRIIKFIDDHDYYGDAYSMNRQTQINASKFWIEHYLPEKKNLQKNRDTLNKINNNISKEIFTNINDMTSKLIE